MTIVLVTGGRDFDDFERVAKALQKRLASLVIQGGATGADALAVRWCLQTGTHYASVPALWDAHGRSAGPLRNAAMLRLRPDVVLAFPGGRGTENMVRLAQDTNFPVAWG